MDGSVLRSSRSVSTQLDMLAIEQHEPAMQRTDTCKSSVDYPCDYLKLRSNDALTKASVTHDFINDIGVAARMYATHTGAAMST